MAQTFRFRDLIAVIFRPGGSGIDLDAVVLINVDGDSRPVVSAETFQDFDGEDYEGSGLVLTMGPAGRHPGGFTGMTPQAIAFHERDAATPVDPR